MAPPGPPTLRHRLEYGGFLFLRGLLRLFPEGVADALGGALGWLAGPVLGIRVEVVRKNLARAFPELDPVERRRLLRASYRHLGREAVATFRMSGLSRDALLRRTEVVGMEALERPLEEGRGAVAVTGHLGNWEVGGAALAARGVPVDGVAFRQRNPLFDRALVEAREALGMRVIPRGRASRQAIRSVREGRVPALVSDQNAGENGLFVHFFGTLASTARGPAVFALRTGATMILGVALRVDEPDRPALRYRVHLEEVGIEPTGDVDTDVRALTAAHTRALEAWVRRAPEQYFWVHKRWKTRPAVESEDGAGGQER